MSSSAEAFRTPRSTWIARVGRRGNPPARGCRQPGGGLPTGAMPARGCRFGPSRGSFGGVEGLVRGPGAGAGDQSHLRARSQGNGASRSQDSPLERVCSSRSQLSRRGQRDDGEEPGCPDPAKRFGANAAVVPGARLHPRLSRSHRRQPGGRPTLRRGAILFGA